MTKEKEKDLGRFQIWSFIWYYVFDVGNVSIV